MKIGLITDIHGNYPALKAVLDDIDKYNNIDEIYCTGDMIGVGPNTNEVLSALFSRDNIYMTLGNHDEYVLALLKGEKYPLSHINSLEHHKWIANRLDKSYVSKLEKLPRFIRKNFYNKSILFIHYHIKSGMINEHISKDPFHKTVQPSLENLNNLFDDCREDIICFGHHHPLQFFKTEDKIYLNPGSLGCYHKPIARYAVLSFDKNSVDVALREVEYDNAEFIEHFKTLDIPRKESLLEGFYL